MVRQAHHPEQGRRTDGVSPVESRPLLHRGEKRQLSPLVEHGNTNPVFDTTSFTRIRQASVLSEESILFESQSLINHAFLPTDRQNFYPVPPVESLKVERQNALYVSAGMNVLRFPKGKP